MGLIWNPVNIINIILCTVIVIMGIISFRGNGRIVPMIIAIAFLIFGISHIITFIGLAEEWEGALMVIRTLGYLAVVFAMYKSIRTAGNKEL